MRSGSVGAEMAKAFDKGREAYRAGQNRDSLETLSPRSRTAALAGWDHEQSTAERSAPSPAAMNYLAETINSRRLDEEQAREQTKRDREAFEGLEDK